MNMNASFSPQKPQIFFDLGIVLPPADPLGNFIIESLNPHLKLKRAGRKLPDQLPQSLRQAIGDHLKMQKQSRPVTLQEKLQNPLPDFQIQVERAVHKLEMPHPALQQR